jgi:hypothetical protein
MFVLCVDVWVKGVTYSMAQFLGEHSPINQVSKFNLAFNALPCLFAPRLFLRLAPSNLKYSVSPYF